MRDLHHLRLFHKDACFSIQRYLTIEFSNCFMVSVRPSSYGYGRLLSTREV